MRRRHAQASSGARLFRCAIYTRVSSDDGLDQEFNSLDAQREAAEAYVKSQASEGWRALPRRFDDGGYSGGSMERPALQALMAAIRARDIDIVVVYKVDRLTRSLGDFAKLVDLFDAHQVTFVSVTQAFNTTTSMGRLTLNMLLSFAQFEREVTGERIRDKIAASKKRGLWVGGIVPLGYRVKDRKLVVDELEAPVVRLIFERYLALGSLPALQAELRARGIVTRERRLATGRVIGGVPLTNGPLAYLLRNRVYLGEINHRDESYPGEHQPVVNADLFNTVQARLEANLTNGRTTRAASGALLLGRLFDDRGNRMSPVAAKKGAVRYRYYVSCVLAQGRKDEAGSVRRVSAPEVETLILEALRSNRGTNASSRARENPGDRTPDETRGARQNQANAEHGTEFAPKHANVVPEDRALISHSLARAAIRQSSIELALTSGETLSIPWSSQPQVRRREIIGATTAAPLRPMKAEARLVLLRQIALGRRWLDEIIKGAMPGLDAIAQREECSRRQIERAIASAFLSPEIVKAASEGRLPRGINAKALADAPAEWTKQATLLSLGASRRDQHSVARTMASHGPPP